MTRHLEATLDLVRDLSQLEEIGAIILYGSVAKGTWRPDSDIDLACVIDDVYRSSAACHDSAPWTVQVDIDNAQAAFRQRTGTRPHIVTYYRSEFEKGILLSGSTGSEPLMAHGRIVFARDLPDG